MSVIRTCKTCGRKNRIPAVHLADTGRCGACKASLPPVDEPLEVDAASFDEIVQNSRVPVLADFWAEWCGPCRAIGPVIAELSKEYDGRVNVGKVNVDHNPQVSMNYGITSIPAILFIKDGKVVDKMIGVQSKSNFVKRIESHI